MNSARPPGTRLGVKICGLTRRADAEQAVAAGAACLGVILAGGPRVVTAERAREVLGPRRAGVLHVGVFGDQPVADLLALAAAIDLDVLQLHSVRDAATVRELVETSGRIIWPVLRLGGASLPAEAVPLAAATGHLVLDALVPGQLGGTGVALDWSGLADAVAALRGSVPAVRLVLAGGLRPSNVADAIQLLSPDVVDVSSGVEIAPGIKDGGLIQQFVLAAYRAAEAEA